MALATTSKTHNGPCRGRCGCSYGEVADPALMAEMAVRHRELAEAMDALVEALEASAALALDFRASLAAGERLVAQHLAQRLSALPEPSRN